MNYGLGSEKTDLGSDNDRRVKKFKLILKTFWFLGKFSEHKGQLTTVPYFYCVRQFKWLSFIGGGKINLFYSILFYSKFKPQGYGIFLSLVIVFRIF
jgi:hypothetical protein